MSEPELFTTWDNEFAVREETVPIVYRPVREVSDAVIGLSAPAPIHRPRRFKANARRQNGRKTMPRAKP